jgi:hypothetical protein
MARYKKQHYLPAVYLKNFCHDRTLGRRSLIWRYDGKKLLQVPVVSQCASDYFYSKQKPEEIEKQFAASENVYQQCVDLIRARKQPDPRLYFSLILLIFDLHVRSAAYDNRTGDEGYIAYRTRLALLQRELLMGRSEGDITDAEFLEHLKRYWRVVVLSPSDGNGILTSDNPSLLVALSKTNSQIEVAMLPITPYHLAVAFDNRVIQIKGTRMTLDDEGLFNQLQMAHAIECVYCDQFFYDKEQEFISDILLKKPKAKSIIDKEAWSARVVRLPSHMRFFFIHHRPPLL